MIQIDELQITMPGINPMEGAELGRLVSEKLATALPENYGNQQIPEIRLQIQSGFSNDVSDMADRIAEQIITQIKMTSL